MLGLEPPPPPEIMRLVHATDFAAELGMHRRTLIRYQRRADALRAEASAQPRAMRPSLRPRRSAALVSSKKLSGEAVQAVRGLQARQQPRGGCSPARDEAPSILPDDRLRAVASHRSRRARCARPVQPRTPRAVANCAAGPTATSKRAVARCIPSDGARDQRRRRHGLCGCARARTPEAQTFASSSCGDAVAAPNARKRCSA